MTAFHGFSSQGFSLTAQPVYGCYKDKDYPVKFTTNAKIGFPWASNTSPDYLPPEVISKATYQLAPYRHILIEAVNKLFSDAEVQSDAFLARTKVPADKYVNKIESVISAGVPTKDYHPTVQQLADNLMMQKPFMAVLCEAYGDIIKGVIPKPSVNGYGYGGSLDPADAEKMLQWERGVEAMAINQFKADFDVTVAARKDKMPKEKEETADKGYQPGPLRW